RSAQDLETAFLAMAGPDDVDGAGWRLELKKPHQRQLAEFKVAVMLDDDNAMVDRAVQERLHELANFLARAGATVSHAARLEYDLLLCPAAASAATPHDQAGERHERTIVVNGEKVPATDQMFWAGYSGAFLLPSTVAPCGLTAAGLPVGVQIVGPQYGDLAC